LLDFGLGHLIGLSVFLGILSRIIVVILSDILVLTVILLLSIVLIGPAFRNIGRILIVLGIGERWRRIVV